MQSFLQTQEWADLKVSQGWFSHNLDGVFILEKNLPFAKNFLYSPEVDFQNIVNFNEFIEKIPKNSRTLFFRLEILNDFDTEIGQKIEAVLKKYGFIKAFEELQPEWRQIIDISKSEEEIFAQMKPKGRYNIKIAQKNNVDVVVSNNISAFYELFCQTAKREGFSIRPKKYFQDLLEKLNPKGYAEMFLAKYNNIAIAAAIVTFYQDTASYLYGASSNEYRNVMAPYLVHWHAIKRAKEKGCKYYDLLAIEPVTSNQLPVVTSNHKYAGITRFKEQFGGRKVHLVGSYDLIYKPFWYKLFKMAEKRRR